LASDGTRIYWTDTAQGAVKSALLDGSAPLTLFTGVTGIAGIAVDGTSVYVTDVASGAVLRASKTGGSPTPIATGQRTPRLITDDGDRLTWANQGTGRMDGSIRQYTKATGQLAALAGSLPGPWSV